MKGIPTTKATQAADWIESGISENRWDEYLPSERYLANELVISRTCLRQALEMLTQRGAISEPNKSKRRKILIKSAGVSQVRQVILLTPKPEQGLNTNLLRKTAELRSLLSKSSYRLHIHSPAICKSEKALEITLIKLLENFPNSQWVLYQCTEKIQRWFADRQLPAIILGSRFPDMALPSLDIDYQAACRHATGMLLAKGHKRLGLVRFRSHLAGDDLAQGGMMQAIETSRHDGVQPPEVINHNFNTDNLVSKLTKIYSRPSPPTALICVNAHHFITCMTFLTGAGIRIPDDVSLVSLNPHEVFSSFWPEPTHYTTGDKLMRELTQKILNAGTISKEITLLIPELVPGKTTASTTR